MKKFVFSLVLTIMDVLVFILCVDKGLSPVGIVGACYIALRCFSRDAQSTITLWEQAVDVAEEFVRTRLQSMKKAKELQTEEAVEE